MSPPLNECLENPSIKDETWDKCVRKSSIGIGLGGFLGGVSSIFFGTSAVILSISTCVTWAVIHCRSLFREQEDAKRRAMLEMCDSKVPTLTWPSHPCPSVQPDEQESLNKICEKEVTSKENDLQQSTGSSYTFPSVFPIPDRPFGRGDEDSSECTCILLETDDNPKIQCTCPIPENDEDCNDDVLINSKPPISDFFIDCSNKQSEIKTPPPAEPLYKSTIEPKCTCPKLEPNGNIYPTLVPEIKCTCPPPELKCTCPPPELKCTCPPPEIKCTCPPLQPICTCPPSKPKCTCPPPELKCTCPPPLDLKCTCPPQPPKCTCP